MYSSNVDVERLTDRISVLLADVASEDRYELTEEEAARVNDLHEKATALYLAGTTAPTGPYATVDDVVNALRNCKASRLFRVLYITRNAADGSFAWYCDPILFRPEDVLIEQIVYNNLSRRYERCPVH
ncbi:MAG TPA: hypothetical protein PK916_09130 [Bacteroidota bacterium]|nr:hypothetical protein [Bacteroidota bacterium]